jgi:hypothetical protein
MQKTTQSAGERKKKKKKKKKGWKKSGADGSAGRFFEPPGREKQKQNSICTQVPKQLCKLEDAVQIPPHFLSFFFLFLFFSSVSIRVDLHPEVPFFLFFLKQNIYSSPDPRMSAAKEPEAPVSPEYAALTPLAAALLARAPRRDAVVADPATGRTVRAHASRGSALQSAVKRDAQVRKVRAPGERSMAAPWPVLFFFICGVWIVCVCLVLLAFFFGF